MHSLYIYLNIILNQQQNKKADITINDDSIKSNKFELLDVLLYRYNNDYLYKN